jgi:hypothetical protein
MKKTSYEILRVGIDNTSEAPIGKDIHYQCNICQSIIPSSPKDSVGCACHNIEIDRDLHRLWVRDYSKITILKKTK